MSRRRVLTAGGAVGLAAGAAGVLAVRAARRSDGAADPTAFEHLTPDTAGHRGGSGTPILLLHGIGVTWRTWKPILPLLEAHHEVFAPTLLGHSGAAHLPDGVVPSVEAIVDGVIAELDELGLDRVHMVGNSLGGWVALELARRGRARSVVVFSPGGAWRGKLRMVALTAGLRVGVGLMESFGDRAERLVLKRWGRALLVSAQVEHPERFDPVDMIADIRAIRQAPVLRPLMRVIRTSSMAPLPDPGCPVRVVWAQRDRVIPFRHHGEPLLERVPSAELIMLDGVGHVPMSDDPTAVARLILEITAAVDRANQSGPE